MKPQVFVLLLSAGCCEARCQDLSLAFAARCSIPHNGPLQRGFHVDVSYADTSWLVDWVRVEYAPAYLFKGIDQFTINDRSRSIGFGGGKCIRLGQSLELRTGLQLRFSMINRSVKTGFSNWDAGVYEAHGVSCEIPLSLAWGVWRSWPLHVFVEGTPGHTTIVLLRTHERPDAAMKVRSNPSIAVLAGFMIQL